MIYGNFVRRLIEKQKGAQIIQESRVVNVPGANMYIWVDGDGATGRNFIKDPYFKRYDNTNVKQATKVARIKIKESKYIYHNDGKDIWVLNSKERKQLIKTLEKPISDNKKIWDLILETVEKETGQRLEEYIDMPDYTRIEE